MHHSNDLIKLRQIACDALDYLTEALERQETASGYCYFAHALHLIGCYKDSVEYYEKSLQIDRHYAPSIMGLAEAVMAEGNFSRALPIYEEYVKQHDEYFDSLPVTDANAPRQLAHAHFQLATLYLSFEDSESALKSIEEIFKINGIYIAEAYALKSQAMLQLEKFWECIDLANLALKRDATLYSLYEIRAIAYEALGKTEEAQENYNLHGLFSSKQQREDHKRQMEFKTRYAEAAERELAKLEEKEKEKKKQEELVSSSMPR